MALDHIDRAVLHYLIVIQGWANTNQIAWQVGISWLTAQLHLKKLNKLGYVIRGKSKKSVYWRINK